MNGITDAVVDYAGDFYRYNTLTAWKQVLANAWYGEFDRPLPAPAPGAPQTAEKMRTWTPADLLAADVENWRKWAADPYPTPPATGLKDTFEPILWTLAAAGALAVLVIVKR